MSAAADLQNLIRFLTQEARIPLATVLSKIKPLQESGLSSISALSALAATDAGLSRIFTDEKQARQVVAAAKRSISKGKKRARAENDDRADRAELRKDDESVVHGSSKSKRIKSSSLLDVDGLALPTSDASIAELESTVLVTNRAPLMLAFIFVLLRHTRPELTVASRLSLAQGYVGAASRARAQKLGIETGPTAEDLGYDKGWPSIEILGRKVQILRRWGEDGEQGTTLEDEVRRRGVDAHGNGAGETREEMQQQHQQQQQRQQQQKEEGEEKEESGGEESLTLWALDVEALRRSTERGGSRADKLPIHTPQSARAYLLKAFDSTIESSKTGAAAAVTATATGAKAKAGAAQKAQRERNLGLLLQALEILYGSWRDLDAGELDSRTWRWYERVRPAVADGKAGWGGRNELKLGEILTMRRQTHGRGDGKT